MLNNQDFTANRTKYLGGSDIGAILGFSKYRTALDVWLEKTDRVVNVVDNLPVRFGSFAEEFVASEYANQTGNVLVHSEVGVTALFLTQAWIALWIRSHHLIQMAHALPLTF